MLKQLHTLASCAALAMGLALARADGSTITWTNNVGGFGSTITGVADIPAAGTYVDATYFGSGGDQTVGTDVFHSATYPTGTTAQSPSGDIALVYPDSTGASARGISPSGYGTVLDTALYAADPSNVGTAITFSNLLPGENYLAQIWVTYNDGSDYVMSATAGNSISLKAELSTTSGSPGQFALGTFTTAGVGPQTETLSVNFVSGPGPYSFLNAVALRDLGPVSVPEPSSLVLLGLGLVSIFAVRRWRQA